MSETRQPNSFEQLLSSQREAIKRDLGALSMEDLALIIHSQGHDIPDTMNNKLFKALSSQERERMAQAESDSREYA